MGRVLVPGGWALFQVSTDPGVHRDTRTVRERVRSLLRGRENAQADAAWWGSSAEVGARTSVEVGALRAAAADGSLEIEQLLDAGSQYTTAIARRSS